jgi:hypothetical protein
VSLPASEESRRLLSFVGAIMLSFLLMNIIAFNFEGVRDLTGPRNVNQGVRSQKAGRPSWPEVAEELHRLGIRSGDKVAVIGYAFDSFWARLARVQIGAEMFGWQADEFWLGNPSLQSEVLRAFASTGARAIVAERVPAYVRPTGWHQVGKSNYYIYVLNLHRSVITQSPSQTGRETS